MRFLLICFVVLLASCSNSTSSQPSKDTFSYVAELNNLPVPSSATEVATISDNDLKNYKVPETFDTLTTDYIAKLKQDKWNVQPIESNKVLSIEKDSKHYTLFITKSSDQKVTNVTVRQSS
ncbi:hypothetical protein PQ456_02975 [Paenibacillus kyungheensis]|uniref:Lipoprotein n=1 Tax=Paenibacillus kyungheensis TaxID=1452732 RepID=A0AAX3M3P3_9BACL|nr:hypothetical protein [Paenibacillus kyungheensis]WCT56513.1 hypothetical protein PQ456_02975 [Paenibacillus kyungheensis]